MKDSFEEIFANKNKVLVVMAHPDDAQVYSGGLIHRLTREGKLVRVVKMTSGNRGSRQEKISMAELALIREKEDKQSLKILGVKTNDDIYLRLNDGEVNNSLDTIGKISEQIRTFKPDILLTHNPEDVIIKFDNENHWVNHRDHLNTGKSAVDAAYPYSRDLLFFPEHFKKTGTSSYMVSEFLFVDFYDHPETIYIKLNDQDIEKRIKALEAHKSQYSKDHAKESTDFFTKQPNGERFERFRYAICD